MSFVRRSSMVLAPFCVGERGVGVPHLYSGGAHATDEKRGEVALEKSVRNTPAEQLPRD